MSRAPDHATFVASLRREVIAFEEFLGLLSREQECLTQAEIDSLMEVSRRKADKVEELASLARIRCAFLSTHALEVSAGGMRQWIDAQASAEAAELSALWKRLSRCAAEAQRINQTNGSLINTRLAYNREALTALGAITHSMGTYGRDGSTNHQPTNRDFGRV